MLVRSLQMPACKPLDPTSVEFQRGPHEHVQPKQSVICWEPTNHRASCSCYVCEAAIDVCLIFLALGEVMMLPHMIAHGQRPNFHRITAEQSCKPACRNAPISTLHCMLHGFCILKNSQGKRRRQKAKKNNVASIETSPGDPPTLTECTNLASTSRCGHYKRGIRAGCNFGSLVRNQKWISSAWVRACAAAARGAYHPIRPFPSTA